MRILHTADWHLGRIFHGRHLTEDQAHVLDQFVALAKEVRPEAIVIAGDVFDRAVPPPEAVELLDETLSRLARETAAHVIIIAGNHDSAERLGFGARLMRESRVHVFTRFDPAPQPLTLKDAHGEVHLYPLPYAEPVRARSETGIKALMDHAALFAHLLDHIRARDAGGARRIVIAHATVLGGEASESERPLIGGAEAVPPALFEGFHYVALGHLHRAQNVGARLRYAGSPLKYSFAEAEHEKSVTLVEMNGAGECRTEAIALAPRHDVRRLRGTLEELLRAGGRDPHPEDYVQATLTDENWTPNATERLRAVWPNVLEVRREWLQRRVEAAAGEEAAKRARLTPVDMVAAFHEWQTGEPLSASGRALIADIVAEVERERREE